MQQYKSILIIKRTNITDFIEKLNIKFFIFTYKRKTDFYTFPSSIIALGVWLK